MAASNCSDLSQHVPTDSPAMLPCQQTVHTARTLTEEESAKLEHQNSRIVPTFKQEKLEKEAQKHWDVFYKRNTTKFFKDRHWTTREFEDLCGRKVKLFIHKTFTQQL